MENMVVTLTCDSVVQKQILVLGMLVVGYERVNGVLQGTHTMCDGLCRTRLAALTDEWSKLPGAEITAILGAVN